HCEVPIDYIIRCVEELQKREADCVGGQIMTCGETWIGRGISLAQASFFGVGGVAFRAGRKSSGYVDTLAFGAYRKSVFNRLGTFDVDLVRNQDDEFNFRLLQAGGRIWMDNTIHVKYHARSNFIKLWKQYSQYGLYKVLVMKKRGALPSMRSLVPGTFVLSLIISLAVAIWGGTIKPILATAGT
ncbi:MAG: glycosyltransferase family 2 protein, partial [Aliifodinibius sp.]|nr:glycosyltransferase family 2 protein [Fodinibius sp.]NIY26661.1 glycosyltransferase family 2 protein [Fodinibius sp.]